MSCSTAVILVRMSFSLRSELMGTSVSPLPQPTNCLPLLGGDWCTLQQTIAYKIATVVHEALR